MYDDGSMSDEIPTKEQFDRAFNAPEEHWTLRVTQSRMAGKTIVHKKQVPPLQYLAAAAVLDILATNPITLHSPHGDFIDKLVIELWEGRNFEPYSIRHCDAGHYFATHSYMLFSHTYSAAAIERPAGMKNGRLFSWQQRNCAHVTFCDLHKPRKRTIRCLPGRPARQHANWMIYVQSQANKRRRKTTAIADEDGTSE